MDEKGECGVGSPQQVYKIHTLDSCLVLGYPENCNFLLLEIPAVLFIDEYQVKVVPSAEPLVDIPESGREVEPA